MPNNIVKSFAKKSGVSIPEEESKWKKAKNIATKEGHSKDYPYIVGITKKMSRIKEDISLLDSIKLLLIESVIFHTKTDEEKKRIKYMSIAKRNKIKRLSGCGCK